jgi:uncharacterized membrane protein
MKRSIPLALVITMAFLLILMPLGRVQAQTYTQYKIQLNSDGSATWIITQVSGVNGTVETWAGFQQNVTTLISEASTQTSRAMSVDGDSLQISTNITSSDSKTTQYMFTWLNFSIIENGQLKVGDVFSVAGFFDQLYGDGALQINYPANYKLESVSPTPDQKDTSTQTLQWLGTQFFVTAKPSIILQAQEEASANSGQQQPYVIIASVSAIVVVAVAGGVFFAFRRQKKKKKETAVPTPAFVETEEEKVLRVLRANGGSAYQSAITEQCRFSKAKTSQLLSGLEAKGIVKRYKRGRDKVVNLVEQAKSEK